jgi:hypothetical protein
MYGRHQILGDRATSIFLQIYLRSIQCKNSFKTFPVTRAILLV